MNAQPTPSSSLPKLILQRLNGWLSANNKKKSPNIWHRIYKWNYDHHFLKNFLKITNKILKGLNRYHVFKVDYVYLAIGLGLGFTANYIENNWENVQNYDVKPHVANLIMNQVLKSQSIRLKLQQTVNDNVLTNEDIQTNLHFVLINKVLDPQRQKINVLVKQAIIASLQSQTLLQIAEKQAVNAIKANKPLIAREALNFLGGPDMHQIIIKFVPPLIKGEMVQQTVSREVIHFVTSQLNNQANQQSVYNYLREKVI